MLQRNMMIRSPGTFGHFRLESLFRPASVAVVGAGTAMGGLVMGNLLAGGFGGAILPVAQDGPSVAGVLAYPAIADLPLAPDLAVIASAPEAVGPALAALAARGTWAAVVMGQAPNLREAALQTGVRVLGPGSFGIAVPASGLNASCAHLPPPAGRMALLSQSAALCRAVLDWAGPNGVGFSHVIGIGGNADIGFGMVLDWLSRDSGTGAILLDIRLIRDSRIFLSAARAAARLRPVMAIRAGGLLADPSGWTDAVFDAALHRAGILTVSTLEDLLAATETLTRAAPLRNEGLAIVTNAIGPAAFAADAVLRDGLAFARLTPQTRQALAVALPVGMKVAEAGPIYVGLDASTRLAEIAAMLAACPEVGGVLVVHAPTGPSDAAGIEALAATAATIRIPLIACVMGESTAAAHRQRLVEAGVPVFAAPAQAVRGLLHLVQSRRSRAAARELPPRTVLALAPDRDGVRGLFAAVRRAGRLALTQDEALSVMTAYGLPIMSARHRHPGHGQELLIRVNDDAVFGMAVGFGQGGTPAAIPHDIAVDLPPLNLPLARALMARTRVAAALAAAPDRSQVDSAPVADALVRISQLIIDFPEIATIEINPLLADAGGVVAAHVGLTLRPFGAPPGRLSIPPYPTELTGCFQAGLDRLVIRPIRPEDAEAHLELFRALAPEDVRMRFFTSLRELPPEQIISMTQVDYEREMAFVAVRDDPAETVGVARLVRGTDGTEGEFAAVVHPAMKGRGIATHLMERLIDWARAHGVQRIIGLVLAENAPMMGFVRHLGFTLRRLPEESDIVEARLSLDPDQSER